jgi:hypothetical protein
MNTTPNNSPATDLKISGDALYQDSLKNTWESDGSRPWDIYAKKQRFSHFWDNHNTVDRTK